MGMTNGFIDTRLPLIPSDLIHAGSFDEAVAHIMELEVDEPQSASTSQYAAGKRLVSQEELLVQQLVTIALACIGAESPSSTEAAARAALRDTGQDVEAALERLQREHDERLGDLAARRLDAELQRSGGGGGGGGAGGHNVEDDARVAELLAAQFTQQERAQGLEDERLARALQEEDMSLRRVSAMAKSHKENEELMLQVIKDWYENPRGYRGESKEISVPDDAQLQERIAAFVRGLNATGRWHWKWEVRCRFVTVSNQQGAIRCQLKRRDREADVEANRQRRMAAAGLLPEADVSVNQEPRHSPSSTASLSQPFVNYNNHTRFNEHGVRVMNAVGLTVTEAPQEVTAPRIIEDGPSLQPPPQSLPQPPPPPPLQPLLAPSQVAQPPPPYHEVPQEMWLLMFSLPFRVKYEVEALIAMKKLVRWAMLPLAFAMALDECVRRDGEGVCIAALRAMAKFDVLWYQNVTDFETARAWAAVAPFRQSLARSDGASIATQRSVEVLACYCCCPSGRVIVRPAEFQASNRVLRLVGDFCGTDVLLRVSFVNDGTMTPVNKGFGFDPDRSQQTIAKFWREFRSRRRSSTAALRTERVAAVQLGPSKWDAVATALREGIRVGGELFRWLAPSSSQMKSMGMWFVRELEDINATMLRQKLGDFSKIETAALYLSRLGQTLSGACAPTAMYFPRG